MSNKGLYHCRRLPAMMSIMRISRDNYDGRVIARDEAA